MLEGEILVAEKKVDEDLSELNHAIKQEDELSYYEPPAWMIPGRHLLGAVLMKAGRFAEAEKVYRDDLARLPDNGWSLFGLAESLREQKKNEDEAAAMKAKSEKSWAKADLKITTSCLCQAEEVSFLYALGIVVHRFRKFLEDSSEPAEAAQAATWQLCRNLWLKQSSRRPCCQKKLRASSARKRHTAANGTAQYFPDELPHDVRADFGPGGFAAVPRGGVAIPEAAPPRRDARRVMHAAL